jgi:hypothetical protein
MIQHTSHTPPGRDPFGSHKDEADVYTLNPYIMSITMNLYLNLLNKKN